jgi:hypothetical protein
VNNKRKATTETQEQHKEKKGNLYFSLSNQREEKERRRDK